LFGEHVFQSSSRMCLLRRFLTSSLRFGWNSSAPCVSEISAEGLGRPETHAQLSTWFWKTPSSRETWTGFIVILVCRKKIAVLRMRSERNRASIYTSRHANISCHEHPFKDEPYVLPNLLFDSTCCANIRVVMKSFQTSQQHRHWGSSLLGAAQSAMSRGSEVFLYLLIT
jgi:hypothetical protein